MLCTILSTNGDNIMRVPYIRKYMRTRIHNTGAKYTWDGIYTEYPEFAIPEFQFPGKPEFQIFVY